MLSATLNCMPCHGMMFSNHLKRVTIFCLVDLNLIIRKFLLNLV